MIKRVAVLGAGSWGSALASVLSENGCEVTLWARRKEVVEEINQRHTNQTYLPGASLHAGVYASSSLEETVRGKELILFVVPSQSMRETAREVSQWIEPTAFIAHAAKGFELNTWKRMSEVLAEELPAYRQRIAVLSGPSHAEEVIQKLPTTVVVASTCKETAEAVQAAFMSNYFRVYTNPDLIGVELGGALKNVIALAAGLVDGWGMGDNTKAALITRGLAEMARLGVSMGARPSTFVGLAGVGDLVATCTSPHSRNWRAGQMISQGKKLDQVLAEIGMVVEGVKTTSAAHTLAKQYQVEMPLTNQLYAVLFEGKDSAQALNDLMKRDRTHEIEEMVQGW